MEKQSWTSSLTKYLGAAFFLLGLALLAVELVIFLLWSLLIFINPLFPTSTGLEHIDRSLSATFLNWLLALCLFTPFASISSFLIVQGQIFLGETKLLKLRNRIILCGGIAFIILFLIWGA